MVYYKTSSVEQTVEVGIKLGKLLQKGDIVCLSGNLGTGKTAFTNGIAKSLGIDGYITSPTFTIVNEYRGDVPLYHFDAYRLADSEEMFEIGFEEYIEGNGVVVIEWPQRISDILPQEYIWIEIKKDMEAGTDARVIEITFKGSKYGEYEINLDLQKL